MNNQSLETLEHQLSGAQSLDDCKVALSKFLLNYGLGCFSFTYYTYHPLSANQLKYDVCSNNFLSWHTHYLEEQYNDIDSTLKFVYNNHLPIYWDLEQQLTQAKNEKERQMRLDSIAFGAQSGLSIPIHGPHNNFAILLLVKMQGDKVELNNSPIQYHFLTAAHLYFHYLNAHLIDDITEIESYKLTQRELQCLYLLAKNYSLKEMAQKLEVTERTVNFHIQKINKKLGTSNKYQSLNKAMSLRLIVI